MTWSENGNSLKSTMLSKNNRKNDKIISIKGTKKMSAQGLHVSFIPANYLCL